MKTKNTNTKTKSDVLSLLSLPTLQTLKHRDAVNTVFTMLLSLPTLDFMQAFDCIVFGRADVNSPTCAEHCEHIDSCLQYMELYKQENTRKSTSTGKDVFGLIIGKSKSIFIHQIFKRALSMRGEKDSIVKCSWNPTAQTFYDTLNELRGTKKTETNLSKFYKTYPITGVDSNGLCFIRKNKLSKEQRAQIETQMHEYKLD